MKTIVLTTVLFLAMNLVSNGKNVVAKGQSNSAFGTYTIEQLENHMMFNNKELDQYVISYENSALKVLVAIDKQKKCKKYYVLAKELPVQYECNGTYFGIKKLDKGLASQGYATSLSKLDREEFYHQRVLTSETTATLDHLNLIASYYPGLFS